MDPLNCVVHFAPRAVSFNSGWNARGVYDNVIDAGLSGTPPMTPLGDDGPHGNSGAFLVDSTTINKACQMGYIWQHHTDPTQSDCRGTASIDLSQSSMPSGDGYSSCGDNESAQWNQSLRGGQGDFDVQGACALNGNLWMNGGITCKCVQPPPMPSCTSLH
jgi:hypothetical protein